MTTDDLIVRLARDAEPMTPLAAPGIRAARWSVVALLAGSVAVTILGVRGDLAQATTTPSFQVQAALLLLITTIAAGTALGMAVPGEVVSRWRVWGLMLGVLAWGLWLTGELGSAAASGSHEVWRIDSGWGCVTKLLIVAAIPGSTLMAMMWRGAVLDHRPAVTAAGLAAASLGAVGVVLTCPMTAPMHLLVWHAGAALAMTVLAGLVGAPLFAVWMRQRQRHGLRGAS